MRVTNLALIGNTMMLVIRSWPNPLRHPKVETDHVAKCLEVTHC